MVNIHKPLRPVNLAGQWPPANSTAYRVKDTDDWWSVADKFRVNVFKLIEFNFQTRNPEEINWYLRELVGCKHSKDGFNYAFLGADSSKGRVYIPNLPPPNVKKTFEEVLAELKMKVQATNDQRKNRMLCMIDKLEHRGDDRVIYWNQIAPDNNNAAPILGVRRRDFTFSQSAVDPQWLFDHIKSVGDIDQQPTGNGIEFGKFVTSLRKNFTDPTDMDLDQFAWVHDQIVETHKALAQWNMWAQTGRNSFPREYRAIKNWVDQMEGNTDSVLSCVVTSGT